MPQEIETNNKKYFYYQKHIWCLGPCLRAHKINSVFVRTCCIVGLSAVCGPMVETCGLLLGRIKIKYQRLEEGEEKDISIV